MPPRSIGLQDGIALRGQIGQRAQLVAVEQRVAFGPVEQRQGPGARRLARRERRREEYRRGLRPIAIAAWNITKEHNVGSLVRTAHAVAATEVLLIGERDWNVEAARTGFEYARGRFSEAAHSIAPIADAGDLAVLEVADPGPALLRVARPTASPRVTRHPGWNSPRGSFRKVRPCGA